MSQQQGNQNIKVLEEGNLEDFTDLQDMDFAQLDAYLEKKAKKSSSSNE